MHFRNIVVKGKPFKWFVGRSNVVIKTLEGKKISVDFSTLTGWSWNTIERAQWKKYFSITPKFIATYIEDIILAPS